VLAALAAIQTLEAYQHLVNKYCQINELYKAYQQIKSEDDTITIQNFTMHIHNIVNMGFIEERHFGLFKRKRWTENKYMLSNII
jgi:hypothetical protein